MSQTIDQRIRSDGLELQEKLFRLANLQADTALKEAQSKLAGIQKRNLHADTGLKRTQDRYAPWQVVIGAFTAGAAMVGAAVAVGHWL